jgi:hypothetical protein
VGLGSAGADIVTQKTAEGNTHFTSGVSNFNEKNCYKLPKEMNERKVDFLIRTEFLIKIFVRLCMCAMFFFHVLRAYTHIIKVRSLIKNLCKLKII